MCMHGCWTFRTEESLSASQFTWTQLKCCVVAAERGLNLEVGSLYSKLKDREESRGHSKRKLVL